MQTESAAALPADLHPNVTAAASSVVAPNYNHVLITDGWKLKTSLLALDTLGSPGFIQTTSAASGTHLYQTTPFQTAGTSRCFL